MESFKTSVSTFRYIDFDNYQELLKEFGFASTQRIIFSNRYHQDGHFKLHFEFAQNVIDFAREFDNYLSFPYVIINKTVNPKSMIKNEVLERIDSIVSLTAAYNESPLHTAYQDYGINSFKYFWGIRNEDLRISEINIERKQCEVIDVVHGDSVVLNLVYSNDSYQQISSSKAKIKTASQGLMLYYLTKYGFFRDLSFKQLRNAWTSLTGYKGLNNYTLQVTKHNLSSNNIYKKGIKQDHFNTIRDICQKVIEEIENYA